MALEAPNLATAQTHIRLERTDREEAAAIIVPLAGASFLIDQYFQTIVVTANGLRFEVVESFNDIEQALGASVVRVNQ